LKTGSSLVPLRLGYGFFAEIQMTVQKMKKVVLNKDHFILTIY